MSTQRSIRISGKYSASSLIHPLKSFDPHIDIKLASALKHPLLGILALLVLPAGGGSRDAAATQAATDSIASSVVGAGSAIAAPGTPQSRPATAPAPGGGAAPALPPGPGSAEVRK